MTDSTQTVPKNQSLLEKFNIPIKHLDFEYIGKCTNAKEVEKIVMILESGEEGFYPDLTSCALDRLRALKPKSKVFRREEPLVTRQSVSSEEWTGLSKSVKDWTVVAKEREQKSKETQKDSKTFEFETPIRCSVDCNVNDNNCGEKKSHQSSSRIGSTDYAKWDKYDADTEALKMDLVEERNRERANIAPKTTVKTEPISAFLLDQMSIIEKEELANRHKNKGNEYFQCGDFKEALNEYNYSISIHPCASAFNNRALVYIKLKENDKAISDCNQCLESQPSNLKALLRKAQAYMNDEKRRSAYQVYCQILKLYPDCVSAEKHIADLQQKLPDLPPVNAFRMKIEEESEIAPSQVSISKRTPSFTPSESLLANERSITSKSVKSSTITTTADDTDFAKLIVPNKIVKNKFKTTANAVKGIAKATLKKNNETSHRNEIRLFPTQQNDKVGRVLFKEITEK